MPSNYPLGQPSVPIAMGADPIPHTHPNDVVEDATLTLDDKRRLLASWASDANAVSDRPSLRQLGNGAQVSVRAIVDALKMLDDGEYAGPCGVQRRKGRKKHSDDDGDDRPPCPYGSPSPSGPQPSDSPQGAASELELT